MSVGVIREAKTNAIRSAVSAQFSREVELESSSVSLPP